MIVQSKYQTRPLPSEAEPTQWASDGSARKLKAPGTQHVSPGGFSGRQLNKLQSGADTKADLPFAMSGASDPSKDWNAQAVEKGYRRLKVDSGCATDVPMVFYRDVTVDGDVGVAERQNVMDRI